jgi:hypothetical protein
MTATTLRFGGTATGSATDATIVTVPDLVTLDNLGTVYNPYSGLVFADSGVHTTDPNPPHSVSVQNVTGFLKFTLKQFSAPGDDIITITTVGSTRIGSASVTGAQKTFSTIVFSSTGVLINTAVPSTSAATSVISLYGTYNDILAMVAGITITRPVGSTASYSSGLEISFQYTSAQGGAGSGATTTGAASTVGATTTLSGSVVDTSVTPCYVRGTTIAGPDEDRGVETLEIGMLLLNAAGEPARVKWIGTKSHSAACTAANPSLRPVLFQPGSIAPGIPTRALLVSPMHGMMIDDVIVPAAALVNGTTILRPVAESGVDYFHIELEAHDLILAEGAVAETFMDNDSRAMFDNAAEYTALYGGEVAGEAVAPRVEEGFLLEAIRRRLAGSTVNVTPGPLRGLVERITDGVLEGWATCDAGAVELEVLVDGEVVSRLLANRYRTDLDDAGISSGCAGFTVALPASVDSLGQVTVRAAADGTILPVMALVTADA